MRTRFSRIVSVFVTLALLLTTVPVPQPLNVVSAAKAPDLGAFSVPSSPLVVPSPDHAHVSTALSSSPVMFIENVGQFALSAGSGQAGARFQERGGDRTIWLAEDAIWVTVMEKPDKETNRQRDTEALAPPIRNPKSEIENQKGVNLKLSFAGANPHPRLEPFNRLDTHVSYFIGNDPTKWHADVPVWGGARYADLYPGIDLEITSENGQTVQRVVSHPGADLSQMRLQVDGADIMVLNNDHLQLTTAVGEFSLPLLQVANATLARPTITGNQITLPFASATSHSQSSVLTSQSGASDLLYSTFLGSGGAGSIAIDGSGAAYVMGLTTSSGFPTTPGAFDTTYNGGACDVFVVKLNPAGSALTYATFLGGSGDDYNYGIAVDGSGAVYVTGWTTSSDFPTTPGAFDATYNGGYYGDAFVAKLNAAGSALAYATFLGGSGDEYGHDIAVDGSGAAYVTGATTSSNFPTTPGAFDTFINSTDYYDVFVVKLNPAGSVLVYATFLGGIAGDFGFGIAIDSGEAAYVTGHTDSPDFPTTSGAFDTTYNAGDAFVVKLNAAGSSLTYATFLGGNRRSEGWSVAIDSNREAYVTGNTQSSNFPTTPGAFDTTFNGFPADAFVVKLNAAGSALDYATFLGGSDGDYGRCIAVDGSGTTYVTGDTESSNFPTTPGAFDTTYNSGPDDAFVVKLNPAGSALVYATFLGGSNLDGGGGIVVDGSEAAYVTGGTSSSDFPITPGAFDTTIKGSYGDAFVAKLAMGGTLTILKQVTPSSPRPVNFGDLLTYTIQVISPTNGALVFYDPVPTYTTYLTNSLNAPAGVVYDSSYNAISGTLNLTASVPVAESFAVQVEVTGTVDFAPLITNRACVHSTGAGLADCLWSNEVWSFTNVWATYLPIVLRSP